MSWKFVDEAAPPQGTDVLVWNGEHASVAKLKRGRFVAQAEGGDVMDPWEKCLVIKGVTHWQPLPKSPR